MPQEHFHKKKQTLKVKDIFIHQKKMTRLKIILVLCAVVLGTTFILWPMHIKNLHWIESDEEVSGKTRVVNPQQVQNEQSFQKEMIHPFFKGQDAQNRPFQIEADYAQERPDGELRLQSPKGSIELEDERELKISALHGMYKDSAKKLFLKEKVVVIYEGCQLETEEAIVDLSLGRAYTKSRVFTKCPGMEIHATGFEVNQKNGTFSYKGRPQVTFTKTGSKIL